MSVVPHFDVVIDPANLKEDFVQILTEIRPKWERGNVRFSESALAASSGLLNKMVRCHDGDNKTDALMVRVLNDRVSEKYITDRKNEVNAIKYFHPRGCAPNIQATFRNGFCYEFIQGEVLSPPRLREEKIWRSIAEEFAKFHTGTHEDEDINRNNNVMFKMMTNLRGLYPPVMMKESDNERMKKTLPTKEQMNAEFDTILNHLSQLGSPVVFCHNDTRAENIVWNETTAKVHFVDFELAGYNYQAFEIACHFSRYAGISPPDFSQLPDEEFQNKWLRVYLRKVFQLKGKNPDDVTDTDVRRIYVQVANYHLLTLLCGSLAVTWEDFLGNTEGGLNVMDFSEASINEYHATKKKTLALRLP